MFATIFFHSWSQFVLFLHCCLPLWRSCYLCCNSTKVTYEYYMVSCVAIYLTHDHKVVAQTKQPAKETYRKTVVPDFPRLKPRAHLPQRVLHVWHFLSHQNFVQKETVITHSVRSMYVVVGSWLFTKLITVSTCFDIFLWKVDTIFLGQSCTWTLQVWPFCEKCFWT